MSCESFTHRGLTIKIERDQFPLNPRENFDNLGTMVCWHRRYNLGDKQPKESLQEWMFNLAQSTAEEMGIDFDADNCSYEQAKEFLNKHYIFLDLYLYDHSGIIMSCRPFFDWDSGKIGFIYCSNKQVIEEWGVKSINDIVVNPHDQSEKTARDRAIDTMAFEVKAYGSYISDDMYCYSVEDKDGNILDSCGGFCGFDSEYMKEEAIWSANYHADLIDLKAKMEDSAYCLDV